MENTTQIIKKVYTSINCVQDELSKIGISKDKKNLQQNYKFRGIDDVFNTLSPLLAKHKLCILPRMLSREVVERPTAKGGVLFYVTLAAEFDFISAEDGSMHTVAVFGEAMDSGDKATNKAMSAAYKYACLQAFAIPTEGMDDADYHTPEPKAVAKKAKKPASSTLTLDMAKQLIASSKELNELKTAWAKIYRNGFAEQTLVNLEMLKNDRKAEIEELSRDLRDQMEDAQYA